MLFDVFSNIATKLYTKREIRRIRLVLNNLDTSEFSELVDKWIFNEQYRKIVKDKAINGYSIEKTAEINDFSPTQTQRILSDCLKEILIHI